MKKYDVVIVGAGPGGLRCAEVLSESGKSVLLLEKNSEIGPKVCAGGITRKCFEFLGKPNDIIGRSFDDIIFKKFGAQTRLDSGEKFVHTVKRDVLGKWQLKRLQGSSVEVRTGVEVKKISDECIITGENERIEYEYLVGADGSSSIVRKYLGLKTIFIGLAFHYIIPANKRFENIEIFFDSKLFYSWYSWIFPHDDYVSVGFGCFPKTMTVKKAKKNLDDWLEKMKIDVAEGEFEAHMINCDYRGFHFGNVFLIGDAAGFASGFTGEGIYQALVSGDDVARIILDKKHKPRLIKEILLERRIHHAMLLVVMISGIFRDTIFSLIMWSTKNKYVARFLLSVLT
ncbi:MAG: NAD(P)/FAD-dependent oxidoreductase [Candidatus Moranbacteria bacterium]|nr:NAD(P)/FAD-dependent oxidoreductase [Candidatus Moranbacteria bacterium]